jgi:G protein beta subunit-like protein
MDNSDNIILISSCFDNSIQFWSEFTTGAKPKAIFRNKETAINALEMSKDKDKVAFATGNTIKFVDLNSIKLFPVFLSDLHEGLITNILFPKKLNNIVITGGEDNSVRISDMRVGKVIKSFFHSNFVNSIVITNNNKDIIAADENGTIKIWDMDKGEMKSEYNSNIEENLSAFKSITLSENGEFLVGGKSNGNICIFDLKNNDDESQNLSQPKIFKAHDRYITKCLLSPENNILATCSADKELKLWERKNLRDEGGDIKNNSTKNLEFDLLKIFKKHTKWVWDCDFTVDSQYILSCSSDRTIKLWEIKTGKMIANIEDEHGGINNIILCD